MLPGALRPATARRPRRRRQAGHPAITRGEERPQADGRAGLRLRRRPRPARSGDVISSPSQKRKKRKAQAGKAEGKGKPCEPQARGKWLTASVTDDIPAVIAAAFGEADRRDPAHQREWVVLIDGNNTQIEAVTAEAARCHVTATIVIDFIHVIEYLWKAAWSFFDKAEPAAEEWVASQARKILLGSSDQVAAGIRRRVTTYGYTGAERAGADECARYLSNKKDYLGYDTALGKGSPIATGVIEERPGGWSRTEWTSPARDGASKAPRPSSSSAPSPPAATSTTTGATTSAASTNASTTSNTVTTSSSQHNQLTSKSPPFSDRAATSYGIVGHSVGLATELDLDGTLIIDS